MSATIDTTFSEIRARVQVWSASIPADDVTQRLGVAPASVGVKGEVWNARSGAIYTRHLWESRVVEGTSGDVAAYLADLLVPFLPRRIELAALAAEPDTDVSILLAIEIDSSRVLDDPKLVLAADVMADIASLGATLDVDIQLF